MNRPDLEHLIRSHIDAHRAYMQGYDGFETSQVLKKIMADIDIHMKHHDLEIINNALDLLAKTSPVNQATKRVAKAIVEGMKNELP